MFQYGLKQGVVRNSGDQMTWALLVSGAHSAQVTSSEKTVHKPLVRVAAKDLISSESSILE